MSALFAIPAAHHRLLWIHPFVDGNGRVARNIDGYKETLAAADLPRQGDLDGRASLSLKALWAFCQLFFKSCVGQVAFMEELLNPREPGRRIKLYARDEIDAGRLTLSISPCYNLPWLWHIATISAICSSRGQWKGSNKRAIRPGPYR